MEGKVSMSPELYQKTCKWLLEWGTLEGIFAALAMYCHYLELGFSLY
jgi:hypothetical protein